jgi:hypothetical protein
MGVDDGEKPRRFSATCRRCRTTVLSSVAEIAEVEVHTLRAHAMVCERGVVANVPLGALLQRFDVRIAE